MADPGFVEIRRAQLHTREAEETVEYVSKLYTGNIIQFQRAAPGASVRNSVTAAGSVMATEIRSTVGYIGHLAPIAGSVYFQRTLAGNIRLRGDGHDIWQQREEFSVYPMDVPIRADCENHDVDMLHIPDAVLADLVAAQGVDPAAFRFESLVPVDRARERFWGKLFELVHHEIALADPTVMTDLVVANLARTLAAAALTVFPNPTMDQHRSTDPAAISHTALQRAVDYLHAHPTRQVTVGDLAAHTGIGPRALQYAFRKRYNATPMEYLRRLRLEQAHQDLLSATPGDGRTVAAVAARWGFPQPGRFAQLYTRTYGHPPSQTLRH
ncbi:helix-turn-helix domain-containing protein [Nocardia sp. NPDC005978]|uniref:AraC family transcriptional regulator n=1 Tax=Nocardia sp. NPDC005978 TaxID=3156725 RepID=UPI0033BDDF09